MRRLLAAALVPLASIASGQGLPAPVAPPPVVTSAAPDHVSVTVYRAPGGSSGSLDLRWLNGFALITEMRTVRLPAGPATIRFDGVADGIVPVSAIVAGLPGGVVEKNRDARLLSPAALVDGSLGRRVTLERTDKASGRVRVEEAVVVSGPGTRRGGVVVRTPEGVEALGCSGLAEKTRYPAVPAGLSARPALSVVTVSPAAATVTATLSYLASDFDWRASYVATLAPDGRTLDLFAWLTLANGNTVGFPGAQVQVVAGRLNHASQRIWTYVQPLRLACYPLGTTTSDLRRRKQADEDIVVTGSRAVMRMMAPPPPPPPPAPPPPPPEDLGDLKLYRVPEPVTVAAHGQKQVALLARARVPFERVYRIALPARVTLPAQPVPVVLKLSNVAARGLGLPLPAGTTTLYAGRGDQRLLLGTGATRDHAVGEAVRIAAGTSAQLQVAQTVAPGGDTTVTITNAAIGAARVEVAIGGAGARLVDAQGRPLPKVDGVATWTADVPPGGTARLVYRTL